MRTESIIRDAGKKGPWTEGEVVSANSFKSNEKAQAWCANDDAIGGVELVG